MLFGIVYTPRKTDGRAVMSLELFGDWRPPVAFLQHWGFAAGGGMGVVEARTAAELSRSLSPFAAFFAFRVEQIETAEEPASVRQGASEMMAIA
jgi:hypothetical protein